MSFRLIKKNVNFDFIGKQKIFLIISGVFVLGSLISIALKGFNYGIDFAGGIELQFQFKEDPGIGEVREILKNVGFGASSVQRFGEAEDKEYLIFLKAEQLEKEHIDEASLAAFSVKVSDAFKAKLGKDQFGNEKVDVRRVDMVGAKVGSDLKKSGLLSVIFSVILILIYIWFRFEYKYAPGAIIALIHDVVITLGAFSFLQKEFNLTILAAVLTIIGYSINDTIVIFDRVREDVRLRGGEHFPNLVNRSINETLSRTILTTLTTLFVVVSLFIYGQGVIKDFAFALLVGMVSGTYSTVFIASPVLLVLHEREEKKKKLA